MKNALRLSGIIFITIIVFALSACTPKNETENSIPAPLNPITKITVAHDDTCTMVVGETIKLDYTVTPLDTDEQLKIESTNPSIVDVINNTMIARKSGEALIKFTPAHTQSNRASYTISINVIHELDYTKFESQYLGELQKATVSVYCKRYNINNRGKEINVNITSGKGVIVKSLAYANYFVTDRTIFDKNITYAYEDWYIIDWQGNKYSISGIQYYKVSHLIGIGMFSSATTYPVAKISNAWARPGDYAISICETPTFSRIEERDWCNLDSSTFVSDSARVLYHKVGINNGARGEAVFNSNGEIIGINLKISSDQIIAISSVEIQMLFDAMFNPKNSNGNVNIM